jgi:hypothetical protein
MAVVSCSGWQWQVVVDGRKKRKRQIDIEKIKHYIYIYIKSRQILTKRDKKPLQNSKNRHKTASKHLQTSQKPQKMPKSHQITPN